MSDLSLRAQLKTMLSSVPGTGKIHDYERFNAADWNKFIELFKDEPSSKVYGWEITREGVKVEKATGGHKKVTHAIVLKGYYGLQDAAATEKIFNAVIDLILQKFIDNKIPGTQGHSLPKVGPIQARMYGGVLCHYAEIRMVVAEIWGETEEVAVDLETIGFEYYLKPGDDIVDAEDILTLT